MIDRRTLIATSAAFAVAGSANAEGAKPMYGLIGRMKATPGKRAELAAILLEGTGAMPGCLSYIVAEDTADADALWITEVWDSQQSHGDSLKLPAVQAAIAKGRPLIAGFDSRSETVPLGGAGLPRS
ncbi:putative quinol monooxygenase [Sphingomonas crusticola]|uniref:putative quinol monooxygenase n=1 Tax=Sphingomonas crusticola TaxID=1697973 RepID=UPI0019679682|nr:putative quinol monooxygenase [Sphingomonas crusticola]